MKRRTVAIIVVCLLALSSTALFAAQRYEYRFRQGEKLRYQTKMSSRGSFQTPTGKSQKFSFSRRAELELRCLSASGGTYKLAIRTTAAKLTRDGKTEVEKRRSPPMRSRLAKSSPGPSFRTRPNSFQNS